MPLPGQYIPEPTAASGWFQTGQLQPREEMLVHELTHPHAPPRYSWLPIPRWYVQDLARAALGAQADVFGEMIPKEACLAFGHYYSDARDTCMVCAPGQKEHVYHDASGKPIGMSCGW